MQSVHGPLLSSFAQVSHASTKSGNAPSQISQLDQLPSVAVVDSGVPAHHKQLEPFRRGTFVGPDSIGAVGSHGTFVASRVVFGDPSDPFNTPPIPTCRFLDIAIPRDESTLDDKNINAAINFAAANYPDVRTFNLSFGHLNAFGSFPPVEARERLQLTQDLDNIIFARDILVVIAAGNSLLGTPPTVPYPNHWQDPTWKLGHWALGFNTLTCGSFVREWTLLGGVATVPFAPSPFTRHGPGLDNSPVPDFSAHGGNGTPTYQEAPQLGVYGLSPQGMWEDHSGTSFAAPLLAREAAFAFQALQVVCPSGTRPFAATIKALLALTAIPPDLPETYTDLARVALGHGEATSVPIRVPDYDAAIFIWQGVIADKTERAKVIFPIPLEWLESADDPVCEVSVAWDSPVNSAFHNVYVCRRVDTKLRRVDGGDAVRALPGAHPRYPLRVRTHRLKSAAVKGGAPDDLWTIEITYKEECEYPPTQAFTPEQRVGIAIRLRDRSGAASPQSFVQQHALAATMTRLSSAPIPVQVPVSIKPV